MESIGLKTMMKLRAVVTTAMTITLAACGDAGGGSASGGASDSGTDTRGGSSSTGATGSEGSISASESASEPTVGSDSMSDSQVSITDESASASASVSDSATNSASGTTTGTGTTAVDTGDTTLGVDTDTGPGTTGTTGTTGGSSSTGGPQFCGEPPGDFPGVDNPACKIAPAVGKFNPVLEWSKSSWSVAPDFNQVMAAPIVVSLTDDNNDGKINDLDVPDIVFPTFRNNGTYNAAGWLRAVSGKDGAEIFNIGDQNIGGCAGVAGGDIDNDGIVEIVTVTMGGQLKAFEHDGKLKWTSPALGFDQFSAAAIADMDADGNPEVVMDHRILNSDGTLRATVKYDFGSRATTIVDMDGDGKQELIGGNAIYDADGKEQWYNALAGGFVGVADIDEDGAPDIVVVGNNKVRLQDRLGNVKWDINFPGGGGGPPTIADYDGDGHPEIGVAGALNYVVFEANGAVLWQKGTQDFSSQSTGSSVYDFEGDGAAEAVYNDEQRLRVYAGANGTEKLNIAGHGTGTIHEYPLVVDADGDGQVEIVVVNNSYAFGDKTGVYVYGDKDGSWRPGRKIWNQHAYSITNVIGRV